MAEKNPGRNFFGEVELAGENYYYIAAYADKAVAKRVGIATTVIRADWTHVLSSEKEMSWEVPSFAFPCSVGWLVAVAFTLSFTTRAVSGILEPSLRWRHAAILREYYGYFEPIAWKQG